ncbi:MAG: response regulator transcription factor [Treponema sp.]|jgi:DNA-binding response OmpR family regulator|nr:response regulator transcription factor [Treponema sp.]
MEQILIVDSTNDTSAQNLLEESGLNVSVLRNVTQAIEWLQRNKCALVISETNFQDHTGFFLVRFIRKKLGDWRMPFVFLSTKRSTKYKVHGLKNGATDYITKPFVHEEFLARVRVQLRIGTLLQNSKKKSDDNEPKGLNPALELKEPYNFGPFTVNYKQVKLEKNGKVIALTLQEFKVLTYLIEKSNQAVKKEELLDNLWQYDAVIGLRTVYTHISWLRDKLRTDEKPGGYIKTIRQIGYMFVPEGLEK